jgi:hypothetical protein
MLFLLRDSIVVSFGSEMFGGPGVISIGTEFIVCYLIFCRLIHWVATHFSPCITGAPPWRVRSFSV